MPLSMFPCQLSVALPIVASLFFFQAEDGIRDHCVTGVQTCALPIWPIAFPSRGMARNIVDRVAVAAFPRRRDAKGFRPFHVREMRWAETRRAAGFFFG